MGTFSCTVRTLWDIYYVNGTRCWYYVRASFARNIFSIKFTMKTLKIYLIVVSVLLVVAIGLGIYVWYIVQNLNTPVGNVSQQETSLPQNKKSTTTQTGAISENLEPVIKEPLVIKKSDLPESQQKMLETIGISGETFTITPTMLSCAEKAVGAERLTEIQKGSAPSTMESIKLLPCLKS